MFDVGWSEATVILLLALLLFGPDKLADFAKTLGRLYGEYKTARRRLELELLYGKEVVDREFIRDLAKLKLDSPAEFAKVVDFSKDLSLSNLGNLSNPELSPEFRRRVMEGSVTESLGVEGVANVSDAGRRKDETGEMEAKGVRDVKAEGVKEAGKVEERVEEKTAGDAGEKE